MILYIVRHGETAYNRDGLGLGRADAPLTELGERQAAAVGRRLGIEPIERIIASPLGRAAVTARAIAGERPVELRHELLELDIGETEGLVFAEIHRKYPEFLQEWMGPHGEHARMPGGESIADLASRMEPLVTELESLDLPSVAIVSHNFVSRVLLCRLLGLDLSAYRSFQVGLASYCTVELRGGRSIVVNINESCHLDALEPPP